MDAIETMARAGCWETERRARQVCTSGCLCATECEGRSANLLAESRAQMRAAARALEARGLAIVPRFLTPEMVEAGNRAADAAVNVGRPACYAFSQTAIAIGAIKL